MDFVVEILELFFFFDLDFSDDIKGFYNFKYLLCDCFVKIYVKLFIFVYI